MSKRSLILLACVAAAVPATGADAATITRDPSGALVYTAAPGEANLLNVGLGYDQGGDPDPTRVRFTDAAAVPQTIAAEGCVAVMSYETQCRLDPAGVRAYLGDRDDRGYGSLDWTTTVPLTIDGGPGRDRLASPTADGETSTLLGGEGDDTVHGDHFEDPSPDVIDGGPGTDKLIDDYVSRFSDARPDVAITLAGGADDGRPAEGDDVRNVEQVVVSGGGRLTGTDAPELLKAAQTLSPVVLDGRGGTDELRGGGGADTIDGGAGDDLIDAGYGNDTITGGPGRDAIFADLAGGDCGRLWCTEPYGNDVVYARDGEADSITCGAGADRVIADAQDVVAPDCEQVERPGGGTPSDTGGDHGTDHGTDHGGDHTTPPPPPAVALALVGRPKLRSALAHGLRLRVSGAAAPVRVVLALAGRTAGVASGQGTLTVRFNGWARKRLAHARSARVVATAAGARVTLRLQR